MVVVQHEETQEDEASLHEAEVFLNPIPDRLIGDIHAFEGEEPFACSRRGRLGVALKRRLQRPDP